MPSSGCSLGAHSSSRARRPSLGAARARVQIAGCEVCPPTVQLKMARRVTGACSTAAWSSVAPTSWLVEKHHDVAHIEHTAISASGFGRPVQRGSAHRHSLRPSSRADGVVGSPCSLCNDAVPVVGTGVPDADRVRLHALDEAEFRLLFVL